VAAYLQTINDGRYSVDYMPDIIPIPTPVPPGERALHSHNNLLTPRCGSRSARALISSQLKKAAAN